MPSSYESTEVMSAPNDSGTGPFLFEKDDYIEMDDILTSELGASLTEIPQQFLDPGEFGEFNEFDQLFHDISMFLEMEPILQGDSAGPSSLSNTSDKEHQHFQALLFDQPQSIISGAFASPSSGVNVMPGSTNVTTSVTSQDGGGGTSPFSSALWAFSSHV
ncbi:NAC domain-containing protein 17 [Raphanus sativus]|nr:NAC domain-containing protein 17 [Raphanus sativus]